MGHLCESGVKRKKKKKKKKEGGAERDEIESSSSGGRNSGDRRVDGGLTKGWYGSCRVCVPSCAGQGLCSAAHGVTLTAEPERPLI